MVSGSRSARADSAAATATPKGPVMTAPIRDGPFEHDAIRRSASAPPATAGSPSSTKTTLPKAWDLPRIALALVAMILLILAIQAVLKKKLPGAVGRGAGGVLKVLVKSNISPRQHLMLVQVGRRLVLIGSGGAELNPLCLIDDPEEVAEVLGQIREQKAASPQSFRSLFGRAGKKFDPVEPGEDAVNRPSDRPAEGEDLNGLTEQVRRLTKQFQKSP
jgi:flagellar biogenesis protein FliO